jgi:dipeptidyl aminopeptidase/acylaminoacyl peptidase
LTESASPSDAARFSLSPRQRLGRYEIVAPLDAGGMGEVYRARDPELRRDVALKVLHQSLSRDPEHIQRFQREAWAASRLEHENIVRVLDVGVEDGVPYIVSELLEGESLRARLARGPIAYHRAVDLGIQIAHALGAAHEKGIYHRDVKPANVFLTTDGRLKLLDFGLAKLRERKEDPADTNESTAETSRAGAVRGTAAYMSPEQVRGEPVDQRTDLFALGAVLYEMFTGQRAFRGAYWVETMHAVVAEEPVDPLEINPGLPEAAAVTVRRCLEKNREARFQSARDLAFHLQQLRRLGPEGRGRAMARAGLRRWQQAVLLAMTAVTLAAIVGALRVATRPPPLFERLTFSNARIDGARFAADGKTVFYSEARADGPLEVRRLDVTDGPSSASSRIGLDGSNVLALRADGLVLATHRRFVVGERFLGKLAEAVWEGKPHDLAADDDVEHADVGPDGIAVAFSSHGQSRLEYPLHRKRYAPAEGSVRFPRVSPDNRYIAFVYDSKNRGFGGRVGLVDLAHDDSLLWLTQDFEGLRGLAWSPSGREVWFAAGEWRRNRGLYAVDLSGKRRTVYGTLGSLTLWDIARDASGETSVLVTRDDERKGIMGLLPHEKIERDFSWKDASGIAGLTSDGAAIVFGERDGIYTRPTRLPSDPERLAILRAPAQPGVDGPTQCCGFADDLLPDGRALATYPSLDKLVVLSRGEEHPLQPPAGSGSYGGALWFPDGRRVLFRWTPQGGQSRAWIQNVDSGAPVPLTPEGTAATAVSVDGTKVAAAGPGGISIVDVASRSTRLVPGSSPEDRPTAWTPDGKWLWVWRRNDDGSAEVSRLDVEHGERKVWKEKLQPPDPAGLWFVSEVHITPSGDTYFYSYQRVLSQMYIVRYLP